MHNYWRTGLTSFCLTCNNVVQSIKLKSGTQVHKPKNPLPICTPWHTFFPFGVWFQNAKCPGFWWKLFMYAYLPIWELHNPAGCWQKMRYPSPTARSTVFKFLTVTMAKLSLQGRMIVAVTDWSFSHTKKHSTWQRILPWFQSNTCTG